MADAAVGGGMRGVERCGRAPCPSLHSAGLRSGAARVRLSATSPRPEYRACGLSASIRHAL